MGLSASPRVTFWGAFLAASLPALRIAFDALTGGLGPDPIARALNRLGYWTLVLLLLSLAPTPLKALFGWSLPIRLRRTVGLFAFFYASLHFICYFAVDQFFDLSAIVTDVLKRKFISIGFLAFLLLIPLALTSTDRSVRRLGFVRWKRLHRLVYAAAAAGVIHFLWRVKADLREPLTFAAVLAVLLLLRLKGPVVRLVAASRSAFLSSEKPEASEPSAG